jgi:hypothetical protein
LDSDALALVAADFNSDGKPDLATLNTKQLTISILLNGGSGAFGKPLKLVAVETARALATADLNGDGRADLITANDEKDSVSVYLSSGNGKFSPRRDSRLAIVRFRSLLMISTVTASWILRRRIITQATLQF